MDNYRVVIKQIIIDVLIAWITGIIAVLVRESIYKKENEEVPQWFINVIALIWPLYVYYGFYLFFERLKNGKERINISEPM